MSSFHPLPISALKHDTRDALTVRLHVPADLRNTYRFESGQYLTFRTLLEGEEVRRNYSLCSTPDEDELTVAVKRVPGGRFSGWAHGHLRAGLHLDVMPPEGRFVRSAPVAHGEYLAIAAGSGITPILSIIRDTLKNQPDARFTLVYGNRAAHSMMFREALEDLKNVYMTRFALVHVLSREQQDVELFNGRIDRAKCDALFSQWIDVGTLTTSYLCGPQSMMDTATESLRAAGVAAERIRRELFVVGTAAPRPQRAAAAEVDTGDCAVTVIQDGRARQFTMARGQQSVLRAALAQGIELPWSCQGGVCSTCRCKVTAGEVEMDTNFALEDYEIARGFRLACQSYPISDQLTLDYDQHT